MNRKLRTAALEAIAASSRYGTKAISIDCGNCGALAGVRCAGGFCQARVQAAGEITRAANRAAKAGR